MNLHINKKIAALFFSFLFLASPAAKAIDPKANPLVFVHATVIDATDAPAQSDVSVVITSDRITAIGRSAKMAPPSKHSPS